MDLGLTSKVALVVASTRGLGFAAAEHLAAEGCNVVICGRKQEAVDQAVARLEDSYGDRVAGQVADVTSPDDVRRLVDFTVTKFGQLDILITNAGGPPGGVFDALNMEAWEKGINLTLLSAVCLIQEALPYLRQSEAGSILTITSISAKQPIAGLLLSNAIRPAVLGLTKTLSQELASDGIRVNSILPGYTRTERIGEILAYRAEVNKTAVEDEMAKITAAVPMGRMGEPEEFGKAATFLVSPAASYISGVMLLVDGGSYAGLV